MDISDAKSLLSLWMDVCIFENSYWLGNTYCATHVKPVKLGPYLTIGTKRLSIITVKSIAPSKCPHFVFVFDHLTCTNLIQEEEGVREAPLRIRRPPFGLCPFGGEGGAKRLPGCFAALF